MRSDLMTWEWWVLSVFWCGPSRVFRQRKSKRKSSDNSRQVPRLWSDKCRWNSKQSFDDETKNGANLLKQQSPSWKAAPPFTHGQTSNTRSWSKTRLNFNAKPNLALEARLPKRGPSSKTRPRLSKRGPVFQNETRPPQQGRPSVLAPVSPTPQE